MLRSTIHLPPIEEGEFLLYYVKNTFRKMGVKSTVTNLVTNPSQLIQRGLAHSFSCK